MFIFQINAFPAIILKEFFVPLSFREAKPRRILLTNEKRFLTNVRNDTVDIQNDNEKKSELHFLLVNELTLK